MLVAPCAVLLLPAGTVLLRAASRFALAVRSNARLALALFLLLPCSTVARFALAGLLLLASRTLTVGAIPSCPIPLLALSGLTDLAVALGTGLLLAPVALSACLTVPTILLTALIGATLPVLLGATLTLATFVRPAIIGPTVVRPAIAV